MFNNKYSKVLTVVLVIVIIAVIGLLAFLGYDVYKKYSIESESEEAVSRFEEELNKKPNPNTNTTIVNTITGTIEPSIDTNIIQNEVVIEPNIDLNTIGGNTTDNNSNNNNNSNNSNNSNNNGSNTSGNSNNNSSSSGSSVKYKGYDVIGTIEIPKTNVKYPIIKQEDVSVNSLKVAICNLYGDLNKAGSNAVLVGHNYRNGTFFSNNKKLSKGDKIYITDSSGKKVTYVIYKKYETGTGDFDYATRDVGDKREISLSTCTDDSKKRLIIWAKEQ